MPSRGAVSRRPSDVGEEREAIAPLQQAEQMQHAIRLVEVMAEAARNLYLLQVELVGKTWTDDLNQFKRLFAGMAGNSEHSDLLAQGYAELSRTWRDVVLSTLVEINRLLAASLSISVSKMTAGGHIDPYAGVPIERRHSKNVISFPDRRTPAQRLAAPATGGEPGVGKRRRKTK